MEALIGEYADYTIYDPEGLCGVPTLNNPELEKILFGDFLDIVKGQTDEKK